MLFTHYYSGFVRGMTCLWGLIRMNEAQDKVMYVRGGVEIISITIVIIISGNGDGFIICPPSQ